MRGYGNTTSVYMYESDATQSIEYRINERINILDNKHLNEERNIRETIRLERGFVENENKK